MLFARASEMSLASALVFAVLMSLLATGCKDDDGTLRTDCTSTVDRAAVLTAAAARVDARLDALSSSTSGLEAALGRLGADPSDANLVAARAALRSARLDYHALAPYALVIGGPGSLGQALNPFPVDTSAVGSALREGRWDPASGAGFDRGFPAIEFALYGTDSARVLAAMQSSQPRRELTRSYGGEVVRELDVLDAAWRNGGAQAFRTATGTDAGSGLGRLINSLAKHFEDVRRDQLGLPFGVSLGFPTPRALEGFYAGQSLAYLRAAIEASAQAFGDATTTATPAAYVAAVGNREAPALVVDIEAQYGVALAAADAIDISLARAVVDERERVQTLYNAMSRQVILLKTDVPAVSCLAITYVDNPSDSD